jgi:hypothetical protein
VRETFSREKNIVFMAFLIKKWASLKFLTCAVRSFENAQENTEEWLQCDACELGFQHGNRHYECCCLRRRKNEFIVARHCRCVDTLHDNMDHRGFMVTLQPPGNLVLPSGGV